MVVTFILERNTRSNFMDQIIKTLELLNNKYQLKSLSILDDKKEVTAHFIARASGIVSGIDLVKELFQKTNPKINVTILKDNGAAINRGTVIAYVNGKMKDIIKVEGLALALLETMSGIASLTYKYVKEIHSLPAKITDLYGSSLLPSVLTNQAINDGGGFALLNDSFYLDGAIIEATNDIKKTINLAKELNSNYLPIIVLVKDQKELIEAASNGCDHIFLHKVSEEQLKAIIDQNLHPSIGIKVNSSLGKIRNYALTKVQYIAIDIIKSAKRLDIDFVYTKMN